MYSSLAKLQQRLSTEEDKQQPLPIHLWEKKQGNFSKHREHVQLLLWITASVSDDNCCNPQNSPWRNRDWPLPRCSRCYRFSTIQWEFSVSEETGNSLFSKDVHNPSIPFSHFPRPTPSSHFPLPSSSLTILSLRSTIKLKKQLNRRLLTVSRVPVKYHTSVCRFCCYLRTLVMWLCGEHWLSGS